MTASHEEHEEKDANKVSTAKTHRPKRAQTKSLAGHDETTLGWRDHRRVVEDVSDSLSKNWRFKAEVCAAVILLCGALLGLATLVVGGRVIDASIVLAEARLSGRIAELSGKVEERLKQVDGQLNAVRQRVEERITKEFEEPKVRETVQRVAETAAAKIIAEHVEPAEKTVTARLESFEKFLDERKAQYEADQASFRSELDVLKKRNQLTRLADRAIGDGSLGEYERLVRLSKEEMDADLQAAANAEIYRVVSAYGILSPSRVAGAQLAAAAVNPAKKEESELTAEELLGVLQGNEPLARARAALVLESRAATFALAEGVANALENERHLEALRYEKAAFSHFTGFSSTKGALDAREEGEWWKKNIDRLRKELPK